MIWSLAKTMFENSIINSNYGLFDVEIVSIDLNKSVVNGKKEDPHVIGSRTPRAGQNSSRNTTTRSGALQVTLTLCVKMQDPIKFLNTKKNNLIKIGIMQISDAELRKKISSNPLPFLSRQTNDTRDRKVVTKTISLFDSLPTFLNYPNSSAITLAANNSSLDYNSIKEKEKLPFTRKTDPSGKDFYEIPVVHSFVISEEEGGASINDLSYFCYSFIDTLEQFDTRKQDFNSNQSKYSLDLLGALSSVGKISSEIVMRNGKLENKSMIFKDQKGLFWTGPVHRMDNGSFMKGRFHSDSKARADYLIKTSIENPKIRDHRIKEAIQGIDFRAIALGDSNGGKLITRDRKLVSQKRIDRSLSSLERQPSFFSNLYLSRDKTNAARFMFSFDAEEALKSIVDYPGLVDHIKRTNTSAYERLVERAIIENVKVSRSAIQGENQVSDRFTSFRENKEFEKSKIIAQSSTKIEGGLAANTTTIGRKSDVSLEYENKIVGTIRQMSGIKSSNSKEIRHFSGIDLDVAGSNPGMYQYEVEIVMTNPMISFIQSNLDSIDRIIGDGAANSTSVTLSSYLIDANNAIDFYDKFNNRFKPSFLRMYNSKYVVGDSSFILEAIKNYAVILSTFCNSRNLPYSPVEIANYLTLISSPNTGSPAGIQTVVEIFKNLRNNLASLMSYTSHYVKDRGTNSEATNSRTNIGATNKQKLYTFSKKFKNIYDSSSPQGVGFDFLFLSSDKMESNRDGLTTLSREDIEGRFKAEVDKFYTKDNRDKILISNERGDVLNPGDKLENTLYSFLTPSNIFLNDETSQKAFVNTSCAISSQNKKLMSDTMMKVMSYNSSRKSNRSSARSTSLSTDGTVESNNEIIQNIFGNRGVSYEESEREPDRSKSDTPVKGQNNQFKKIDAGENLFETDRDTSGTEKREDTSFSSLDISSFVETIAKATNSGLLDDCNTLENYFFTNNEGASNFIEQMISSVCSDQNSSTKTPPLNLAPIQLKALLLGVNKSIAVKRDTLFDGVGSTLDQSEDIFRNPSNYAFLWYNYKSLRRVEVFRGYNNENGRTSLQDPRWSVLKKSDLDNLKNSSIICRMVESESKKECLEINGDLTLPAFNDLFVIAGTDSTSGNAVNGDFLLDGPFNFANNFYNNKFYNDVASIFNFVDSKLLTTDPVDCGSSSELRTEFATSNMVHIIEKISQIFGPLLKNLDIASGEIINSQVKSNTKVVEQIINSGFSEMLPKGMRNVSQLKSGKMSHNQLQKTIFNTSQSNTASGTSNSSGTGTTSGAGTGGGAY
jgi:hypothetical protein